MLTRLPTVTMPDVLDRLIAIADATNGGARGATILSCDILHQDQLYRLQEDLATLLADVANACGRAHASKLQRRFPNVFQNTVPR